MPKVTTLSPRRIAPRVHTSVPAPTTSTPPTAATVTPATFQGVGAIERQSAIENALVMALHFIRQPGDSAANLWAATARTNRALAMLKQASAAPVNHAVGG